ncbi:AraC family transcriptional regulator [Microbacterium karelineae]|uniref:AraC family transcriptional regulator n=1 Tax=Microbacterium karelineae TaxID=2654283 RepID=UPI0012EA16B8|nr:AraC family transcriptional regulator [Microbacterium karelineae]
MGTRASGGSPAYEVMHHPPERELVPLAAGESFRWMEHDYPAPIARWNYHPEVEIHLIRRGTGNYIIGNTVGAFGAGQVAIVGSGVPHDWMSDLRPGEVIRGRDAVIQVSPVWLEQAASVIPELHRVQDLVRDSGRGIIYSGRTALAAAEEIEQVGRTDGPRRIAHFLALLDLFLGAPPAERHYVAHELYSSSVGSEGRAAVDAGLAYVVENLSGDIRMSEAARLAYMSEPTFSKHFKKASGMTFTAVVRRLRIANACRLLGETDRTVAEISGAVGYRNLANFNRQFLAETGVTPTGFRRLEEHARPSAGPLGLLRAGG